MRATYCTVADSAFFPGVVALLNSLRLTGADGRFVVLDLGLTADQRSVLEEHAEVVDVSETLAANPLLYKPFPARLELDGVVVVIDSDMIVTKPLDDVVRAAELGRICLFSDESQDDRWFPEWSEAFGLQAPLRREPYLNSGCVALSTDRWPGLLQRWWQACSVIPAEGTRARGASWDQPFWDGDQDALNAVLMSEVPEGTVLLQAQHVTDVMTRVRVEDAGSLACSDRGQPVRLLHHTGSPKPWQPRAWMRVQRNPYVQLLPRLLFADDLAVRLSPDDVPVWLRPGLLGAVVLRFLDAVNGAGRRAVRSTGGPVRIWLRVARDRLAGAH